MSTLYPEISTAVEIADYFFSQIRDENLLPGDTLPPVRKLATKLGVNPNTVANAYSKLREAGVIITNGRQGSRVAERPTTFDTTGHIAGNLFDLAQGNIDPSLLCDLSIVETSKFEATTGYDISGNSPELLEVSRSWLSKQRISSENLSVFSGALDAMEQALRIQTMPGDSVWVEDPCWPPVLMLLSYLRLKPKPLLVDDEGCCLPIPGDSARAVILTPRAQNPTGVSMSSNRANAWSHFLKSHPDCLLIIDDFWGPLTNTPFPELVNPNSYLYILSLSKCLGPDLRIAMVCGSSNIVTAMCRQQLLGPRWVSHIIQQTAAQLWQYSLAHGLLEKAINSYQSRRHALLANLPAKISTSEATKEGLHIWLPVNSESNVVQNMAAQGWAVQAGTPFRLNSSPGVRISLGNIKDCHIDKLSDALTQSLRTSTWPNIQV